MSRQQKLKQTVGGGGGGRGIKSASRFGMRADEDEAVL